MQIQDQALMICINYIQDSTNVFMCLFRQENILKLRQKIENQRNQLKGLSNSASKIIEKKLSNPNRTKSRPKLNPTFQSKKLQDIQDQKQKIFRQISQTKQLIQTLKLQQQPQVKAQILKRQHSFKQLQKQLQQTLGERKYLKDQLNTNKQKINEIKQSAYNKDFIQNERTLEQLRKQKTAVDKKLYQLNNEQIQVNMFFFQLKEKLQKKEVGAEQPTKVSIQQINKLMDQINQAIGQRNMIQKDKCHQISQLTQKIHELQNENNFYDKKIRQTQGQMMKKNLEERFYQTRMERTLKSTSRLHDKQQIIPVITKKEQLIQPKLKKTVTPIKQNKITKKQQNLIQLGSIQLNEDTKILRDPTVVGSSDVQKISNMQFILSDQKIVGVKVRYLTKSGKTISGQVLSIDRLQRTIQTDISMKDVKQIQYPKNSKTISLKMHKFNGSFQTIGTEYYGATSKQNISLKIVKSISVIIERNKQGAYQKVKGITIGLQDRKLRAQKQKQRTQQKQFLTQQKQQRNRLYETSSPQDKMNRRTQSIGNIHNYKKKLVLRPLRKQSQRNLDHKLLLGKKLV